MEEHENNTNLGSDPLDPMNENIEAPRDSPMGEEETDRESASSVSGRQNQAAAREKGPSGQREGKNKKWERQEPGHRGEADKQNRSLLRALQDAIKNLVSRTKMLIDRAIGRNRILKDLNVAVSRNDKVGIIRTSPTEREHGRNWGNFSTTALPAVSLAGMPICTQRSRRGKGRNLQNQERTGNQTKGQAACRQRKRKGRNREKRSLPLRHKQGKKGRRRNKRQNPKK